MLDPHSLFHCNSPPAGRSQSGVVAYSKHAKQLLFVTPCRMMLGFLYFHKTRMSRSHWQPITERKSRCS